MIRGVSSALGALTASSARFEQAAVRVASNTTADPAAIAEGSVAMTDATVQMAAAQFAMLASLRAASTSTEMVAEMLQRANPAA